jgi:hypothetical protein
MVLQGLWLSGIATYIACASLLSSITMSGYCYGQFEQLVRSSRIIVYNWRYFYWIIIIIINIIIIVVVVVIIIIIVVVVVVIIIVIIIVVIIIIIILVITFMRSI